ncbi:hypothetical protein BSKO_00092 [Bryopsis sp. KO-2023]|nr:hypothetical protein BSKO_00092 [Bryopsis sp. KO-2023]
MALVFHRHGKGSVRVGRVWREGDRHTFAEWKVDVMLDSSVEHAFTAGSNEGLTATDTIKNTVYLIAKQMEAPCSPEDFGMAIGQHFIDTYEKVSKATLSVEQMAWERVVKEGVEHNHGFVSTGDAIRTAEVVVTKDAEHAEVTGGLKGLKVLKSTQSGFVGYIQDDYTLLPETNDRIMATSVTSKWTFDPSIKPVNYDDVFQATKASLSGAFFGPPDSGVYSPSVQFTLYQMARVALENSPSIKSVYLKMPNLHFLPCAPVTSSFDNDVYISTSEPHGDIEATVERE